MNLPSSLSFDRLRRLCAFPNCFSIRRADRALQAGLIGAIFLCILCTGCRCIKEVEILPSASADPALQKVTGSMSIRYKFRDCLSPEELVQVERVKRGIAEAFEKLLADKLTLETYNKLVEAAEKTLTRVLYLKLDKEQSGFVAEEVTTLLKSTADQIESVLQRQ